MLQLEWAVLADKLGLSESMIYAVRAGRVGMSDKAIHRLEALEREAGMHKGSSSATIAAESVALEIGTDFSDQQVLFNALMVEHAQLKERFQRVDDIIERMKASQVITSYRKHDRAGRVSSKPPGAEVLKAISHAGAAQQLAQESAPKQTAGGPSADKPAPVAGAGKAKR